MQRSSLLFFLPQAPLSRKMGEHESQFRLDRLFFLPWKTLRPLFHPLTALHPEALTLSSEVLVLSSDAHPQKQASRQPSLLLLFRCRKFSQKKIFAWSQVFPCLGPEALASLQEVENTELVAEYC